MSCARMQRKRRKGAPVIRISLPWVVEVVRAIDALSVVTSDVRYGDVWGAIYNARTQLEALFTQSFYSSSLRSSREPADALFQTLTNLLNAQNPTSISQFQAWDVASSRQRFLTVFLAELATLPAYFVLQKEPYDTNVLLASGETLFPGELASKVPEAVYDAKEAARALAFDLGTACGFHTFRVLESVVRRYLGALGAETGDPKQRNLGAFIGALEKAGADAVILAALRQLKDLHRNPLVHPEVAILSEEAISIIGMVRSVVASMLKSISPPPSTTMTA